MTPIKHRKRQKLVYRIFARKISCHHYTMSDVDDDIYWQEILRAKIR